MEVIFYYDVKSDVMTDNNLFFKAFVCVLYANQKYIICYYTAILSAEWTVDSFCPYSNISAFTAKC